MSYPQGRSWHIWRKYHKILNLVNIFEYEDLNQEYELYKLIHHKTNCFDYFFKNLIRKAFGRKKIMDNYTNIAIVNRVDLDGLELGHVNMRNNKIKNEDNEHNKG